MRVEERRAKVAALALQGLRHSEIAARLGDRSPKGRVKVSQDLKAVRDAWKASAVRDFDEARGRALAEVALAKREAWAAWRRSKRGEGGPRGGNPRYLAAVLDCLAREAALLGLSAAPSVVVQQNVAAVELSEDERKEAIHQVLLAAGFKEEEVGAPAGGAAAAGLEVPAEVAPGPSRNGEAKHRLPYGPQGLPRSEGGPGADDVEPLF
jgi:hypothetical protein